MSQAGMNLWLTGDFSFNLILVANYCISLYLFSQKNSVTGFSNSGSYKLNLVDSKVSSTQMTVKTEYMGIHRCDSPAQSTHRVELSLSGIHSIMMEKYAQHGEEEGARPTPFRCIYHHVHSFSVRSSLKGRYSTLPLFLLYPYMYSVLASVTYTAV
jgi:hypothetical protein